MAQEAQWHMKGLLLVVCVLDGLSLSPSHGSLACSRAASSGRAGVPVAPAACFALAPVPCTLSARARSLGSFLHVRSAASRAPCVVGRRRASLPWPGAGGLQMIMPGGSGFEEAEDVAERLFRLKTSVQDRDDEYDVRKRSAGVVGADDLGEMGEKEIVELELERPLGFTLKEVPGYGIFVDYVETGGSAANRGVQRGDKVLATSATVGGGMWEKSTMAGVLSALHSGTLLRKTVRIRFERDPVLASIVGFSAESSTSRVDLSRALISVERARLRIQQTSIETFDVALPLPGKDKSFMGGGNPFDGMMPYGLLLKQDEAGVYVAEIAAQGTAAESDLLRVGDRIVATQSSIGSSLWPKKTLDGILSATRTRMGSSITFKIERKVQLGSWVRRSTQVMPASPLDRLAYYSTSGAGISIRKNTTVGAGASADAEGNNKKKRRPSTLGTSLVLLPDEKGWDLVQEIRLAHDRKVDVWPPHITLLRPFVRVADFPEAAKVLDEILNDFPPMTLSFELLTVKHHEYCTSLWLVPDAESTARISMLQEAVQASFPQCKRSKYVLRLLSKNVYKPHMTLGQFRNEAEAQFLAGLYAEKLANFSFAVSHLFLLSRPDKTGPVEQMRVRLGPDPDEVTGLASAVSEYASLKRAGVELNVSKTRSVLLERCTFDVLAFGKKKNVTAITAMVADLAANNVEMDSKLLNTVMTAYIKSDTPQLAIDVFRKFARTGEAAAAGAEKAAGDGTLLVDASVHCYASLIVALGRVGDLDGAHQVLGRMVELGPAPTIRVINSLLGACVRQNNLTAAQKLFSSLTGVRGGGFAAFVTPVTEAGVCVAIQPDEFSFNIMVNAYARAKQVDNAFKMLLEMKRVNCAPDKITYSTLVKACVATGQVLRVLELLPRLTTKEPYQQQKSPTNSRRALRPGRCRARWSCSMTCVIWGWATFSPTTPSCATSPSEKNGGKAPSSWSGWSWRTWSPTSCHTASL